MSGSEEAIHVLHVDDEPAFADMAATFLEREDGRIDVQPVTDPADGLDVLADRDIDCIVSDYEMPERNGIEFLGAVRERYPDLPFILYTGKGSEEVASEAISTGVTDYLQKESGTSQYTVLANRISNAVEQYRSRQAVQETERKLSELAERTDDILFMFDGDWSELLFINSAYEEVWDRSIEELEANPESFLEYVHPEDRDRARASMEQLTEGEASQTEYRVVRSDGERRWVRGDTQPILDRNGNVARIVGQVRDITEQKERELHLETIIDNLPGYVYRHEYEPEYPLQFVKGDAKSITGYTTTELEEDVVLAEEIIHPDDREDLWEDHLQGIETTGRFDSTYRIITKDGDIRWIRDQGQLIEDPVTGEDVIEGFITDVSEQIQRQRELKSQQTFINESLDALQDVYYGLNESGELIHWNERVPEVTGYTDGEIDGRDVAEFFVEEHRDRVRNSVEETIETGSSVVRADVLTTDGERIPYEFRGTRFAVPNREGIAAVGVGRDISEQITRERELERIRDFFTEAERLGDLGAWEFDADGTIVWTDGTRRIHGVDEEFDPTIEEAIEFFHPEDRATIEQAVEDALENGSSYELELRLITAEGDQRWIQTRGKAITDEKRRTVRGFIQDVTEQKERERELRNAYAQLEDAVEAGAVGTWEWHIPDDRLLAGREFARTFDVDPDLAQQGVELDRFLSKIHEDDRDRVEERIEAALAACGDYEAEYRVRDADDDLRWVLARGHVECDGDGTPVRFPGVLVDITERKRIERELEQHNEYLEEFAGVVSHDLQTPLSVVEGRVELAREEHDSEHLAAIESAVERMNRIIEDLLWLAREGQDVGALDPVAIQDVIDDAWKIVADSAAPATLRYADERFARKTVEADENRLAQLFENLLQNALQHVGEDVTVTVGCLDDGFYLEDDGPGIPEDEREKVFTAGYSTHPDGTGFGLRIVEQIVDAHGWEIRVTEGTDGGARFEITDVGVAE
jgi:PAS domain S-box-containing protein